MLTTSVKRIIAALALALLATPLTAEAQRSGQPARVGILFMASAPSEEDVARTLSTSPFWLAMKDLGWIYGQNVVAERRYRESADELRAAAADLARLNVDVVLVSSAGLAKLVQFETKTIPIVVASAGGDLVALGLVASVARPGGNITGVQIRNDELTAKRIEFLKALIPDLSRLAHLQEDVTLSGAPQMIAPYNQQVAAAVRTLGLEVRTVIVHRPGQFAEAFLGMTKYRDQGLLVMSTPFSFLHRKTIVELAAKHRIAAVYEGEGWVEAGGLMSYHATNREMYRRAAAFVDKILRGAKPGDLPVEQPTKFELVINLKTAKALGLTIPPSLLLRADQVIE